MKMDDYRKFGSSDVLMLVAVVLWAVNFSLVKVALKEMSPMGFNGIRLAFASILLILFLAAKGESFRVDGPDFLKLVVLGIVGNTAYQILFINGIYVTTASNTAIIIAITPAFIAMLSSVLKHERLNWAAWTGILISFVGFYLVIDQLGVNLWAQWDGPTGPEMVTVNLLNIALEIECLFPSPNNLLYMVVDGDDGRVKLFEGFFRDEEGVDMNSYQVFYKE